MLQNIFSFFFRSFLNMLQSMQKNSGARFSHTPEFNFLFLFHSCRKLISLGIDQNGISLSHLIRKDQLCRQCLYVFL